MIKKQKKEYLIGIKGIAMTGLAVFLKESGFQVTGSDVDETFVTDEVLKKAGISVLKGFNRENIKKHFGEVIVTGAHGGMKNIEAAAAKSLKIPVYMHGEYIGNLMKEKFGISVAGCHGKTTTSSLVSYILSKAKYKPSYLVGVSKINGLGPGGHFDRGKYIVMEADEYMTCPVTDKTPRFLWQKPNLIILTNIEYDHPDAYKNIDEIKKAYISFTQNLPMDGIVIACIDSEIIREILPKIKRSIITYGLSPNANYQIEKIYFGLGVTFMKVKSKDMDLGQFTLKIPGKHNCLNALAAAICANQLGLGWEKIKSIIKEYTGCKRRFEKIKETKGVLIYDDYAHHPTEIKATLLSVKQWFPNRRLIVIFQPHTFSRTKALFKEFTRSFTDADLVIIPDIYPSAREKFDKTISSRLLVSHINTIKKNAYYINNKEKVLNFLKDKISNGDIIFTMGAGDIYLWSEDIIRIIDHEK